MSHKFIILYGPIRNHYDLAGQIGLLAFWFKELECSNLLWEPANLLLEGEVSLANTLFLMVTNPVFPGLASLTGFHFLPSRETSLPGRWLLLGIFFPSIPRPGCRAHGHLL